MARPLVMVVRASICTFNQRSWPAISNRAGLSQYGIILQSGLAGFLENFIDFSYFSHLGNPLLRAN